MSDPVFSHDSAAAIWGIPALGGYSCEVHVTVERSGARNSSAIVRHRDSLEIGIVRTVGDFSVTSPARTAVDLASARPLIAGVAAIDHVLRWSGVTRLELELDLARRRPFRGVRRVERALAIATGRSDSPLESAVLARVAEHGILVPEQQWPFVDVMGHERRADFRWLIPGSGRRIIAESDGREKYESEEMLAGRSGRQVLWEEKVREDHLRTFCDALVHVYWSDVWPRGGAGLIEKLTRAGVPCSPMEPIRRVRTVATSAPVHRGAVGAAGRGRGNAAEDGVAARRRG